MAEPAAGGGVSVRISGRHPLQGEGKPSVPNQGLDDVASLAGFSKYHFSRLFKNFTGLSFYKYLNKKRIEQAEKLLVDPALSITEVALQSGFSSLSAFIRMFKLIKDCTPTEFRSLYEMEPCCYPFSSSGQSR